MNMALDARMSRVRIALADKEVEPPAGYELLLPKRDGQPGKCFQEAEQIIIDAGMTSDLLLVHGTCTAPNGGKAAHAWIKVPGGLVYDAILGRIYPWEAYQQQVNAVPHRRYPPTEVLGLVNTAETHGPYTPEDEERARAWKPQN
jgi:hypothetical protein